MRESKNVKVLRKLLSKSEIKLLSFHPIKINFFAYQEAFRFFIIAEYKGNQIKAYSYEPLYQIVRNKDRIKKVELYYDDFRNCILDFKVDSEVMLKNET